MRAAPPTLAALALVLGVPAPATAAPCDQVAKAHGKPSIGRVVRALRPGQTACLARGVHRRRTLELRTRGITLQPVPGATATFRGRIVVSASRVRIRGLRIDGSGQRPVPTVTINGDDVRLERNDITRRGTRGVCVSLGHRGYGRADRVLVRANRIHHCGVSNNHEHGLYAEWVRGGRITQNLIDHNADRGIQLYPEAHRLSITRNVIAYNGQGIIFGGLARRAGSSRNRVIGNVIAHSRLRYDVEAWWAPGARWGTGNVVTGNCIGGGRHGAIDEPQRGFTAHDNLLGPVELTDTLQLAGGACRATLAADPGLPATPGPRAPLEAAAGEQPAQEPLGLGVLGRLEQPLGRP